MRIGLVFAAVLAVVVGTVRGDGEDLNPLWSEYKAAVEKNLPLELDPVYALDASDLRSLGLWLAAD